MSTPGTTRWERTPRWERRYREVLDVAATVFAEKSYAGASTRDIAERLGVRQASLYYYFPSKEAALAALARTYQDLIERLFAEGIKAGQLRADRDPHLATLALLGLCNSVITNR